MVKKPTILKHYHNSSIVFHSYVCINNKSMPFNHPADGIRETMVASDCDSFSIFITAWFKRMIFQSGQHWCMDCVTKLCNHQQQQQKMFYFLYKNWDPSVGCPHAFQTIFLLPSLCSKETNTTALLIHISSHREFHSLQYYFNSSKIYTHTNYQRSNLAKYSELIACHQPLIVKVALRELSFHSIFVEAYG